MPTHPTPWHDPAWQVRAEADALTALRSVGRPPTGPVAVVRSTGRSYILTVPTGRGVVWIKHSYALPPGEEKVLATLSERWSDRLPQIVATWPGAVALESLPGEELGEANPIEDWISSARGLAELQAGEIAHAGEWLDLGVRDRGPHRWKSEVEALRASPVVDSLDDDTLRLFDEFLPDFIDRYISAFTTAATLVPQDSGCCNIHIAASGPVFFDFADVVVGHPVFSCDRLLDQVPRENQEVVIEAFLEPLALSREEFQAMRRSNVLHEVLRYHDELAYLSPDDPMHPSLVESLQGQIRVLVEYESAHR